MRRKEWFAWAGVILSMLLLVTFVTQFKVEILAAAYTDLTPEEIEEIKQNQRNNHPICEHEMLYSNIDRESTCNEIGLRTFYCGKCDRPVRYEQVDRQEHTFEKVHIDPTCTKEGMEYEVCTKCNMEVNQILLPMLEHEVQTMIIRESTCSSIGLEVTSCINCKTTLNETELPILEHEKKTETIKKSTCNSKGLEQTSCINCKAVLKETELPQLEHNYKQTSYKAPLPNDNGYRIIKCEYCGKEKTETLYFEPKASNSIYMPTADIHAKFVVGQCNQYYTDTYDITVDYNFINSKNPVMFGHNTRSLGPMYKVKVGDYIYLTENGTTTTYKVTHSEAGVDVYNGTNIQGVNTGVLCIDTANTKTLRIFTCYNSITYGKCRWIILAQPV